MEKDISVKRREVTKIIEIVHIVKMLQFPVEWCNWRAYAFTMLEKLPMPVLKILLF